MKIRHLAIILILAILWGFTPALAVHAADYQVSVDFSAVGDYPAGWDGQVGCAPTDDEGVPFSTGSGKIPGTVYSQMSEQRLWGDDDKWTVLHHALYTSATIPQNGIVPAAGNANWQYQVSAYLVVCNGNTLLYSTFASAYGHPYASAGIGNGLTNGIPITGATDVYLYSYHHPSYESSISSMVINASSDYGDPFDPDNGQGQGGFYRPVTEQQTVDIFAKHGRPNGFAVTQNGATVYSPFAGTVELVSDTNGTYAVTIIGEYYTAQLWNLATVEVLQGDEVTGGCILGKAGPLSLSFDDPALGEDLLGLPPGTYGSISVSIIDDQQAEADWPTWFNSTSTTTCGYRYTTPNCLTGNPNLVDYATGWEMGNTYALRGADFIQLYYLGSAYQHLALSGDEYYVTVLAAADHSSLSTSLTVTLGGDTEAQNVPPGPGFRYLDFGPFTPVTTISEPDIYELRLDNLDQQSIGMKIDSVCVHTETLVQPPGACYFPNPDIFNSGWSLDGGATVEVKLFSQSAILPSPNGTISAPITLYGGDNGAEYNISVLALMKWPILNQLFFFFLDDYVTLDAWIDVGPSNVDLASWSVNNGVFAQTYNDTFTVAAEETVTGDFVLAATAATGDAEGVYIGRICITPTQGGWVGYPNPDIPPSGQVSCQSCIPPSGIDVFAWLAYLGCVIQNVWFCYAAIILGGMSQSLLGILGSTGLLTQWLSAVFAGAFSAIFGLVWMFGDAILAALFSVFAGIWGVLIAMDPIVWFYDLLGFLSIFAAIALGLVGLLIEYLTKGAAIGSVMIGAMSIVSTSMVGAINANALGGTLNCANPSDPLYDMCAGLSFMNTVAGDLPSLQIAGVILVGCMGIYTIMWTIRRIGEEVEVK